MGLSVGTSLVVLAFMVAEQQRVTDQAKPHVGRDRQPQRRQQAAAPHAFMRRGWVCLLDAATATPRVIDAKVVAIERGEIAL